jgi:hypothetical protein
MKAIAVTPGVKQSVHLRELSRPTVGEVPGGRRFELSANQYVVAREQQKTIIAGFQVTRDGLLASGGEGV